MTLSSEPFGSVTLRSFARPPFRPALPTAPATTSSPTHEARARRRRRGRPYGRREPSKAAGRPRPRGLRGTCMPAPPPWQPPTPSRHPTLRREWPRARPWGARRAPAPQAHCFGRCAPKYCTQGRLGCPQSGRGGVPRSTRGPAHRICLHLHQKHRHGRHRRPQHHTGSRTPAAPVLWPRQGAAPRGATPCVRSRAPSRASMPPLARGARVSFLPGQAASHAPHSELSKTPKRTERVIRVIRAGAARRPLRSE